MRNLHLIINLMPELVGLRIPFAVCSTQNNQKLIDVYCPIHHNWIGHYEHGSKGVYYKK